MVGTQLSMADSSSGSAMLVPANWEAAGKTAACETASASQHGSKSCEWRGNKWPSVAAFEALSPAQLKSSWWGDSETASGFPNEKTEIKVMPVLHVVHLRRTFRRRRKEGHKVQEKERVSDTTAHSLRGLIPPFTQPSLCLLRALEYTNNDDIFL